MTLESKYREKPNDVILTNDEKTAFENEKFEQDKNQSEKDPSQQDSEKDPFSVVLLTVLKRKKSKRS